MKKTIQNLQDKKEQGQKITMLTAADYPTALLLDQAAIDVVLVGDSLANVALGLESTRDIGMAEMLHHTRAVTRAVQHAVVIGDMPYDAYQTEDSDPVFNARQFMDAGCDAVKIEWFNKAFDVAKAIIDVGVPVMGHVGLTPQTAASFTVQGRDEATAKQIKEQAQAFAAAGCFGVVFECIPQGLAQELTETLPIITVGIGAGPSCDGQVLVTHDVVGLFQGQSPKFAKRYVNVSEHIASAVKSFQNEVQSGTFPDQAHSFQ